jgi:hypothetical protein
MYDTTNEFAKVSWQTDDIIDLKPNWPREKALAFINEVGKHFEATLNQYGWEVLEITLANWEEEHENDFN